jgi:tetratricopeptide (TPR) repeat protein
MTALQKRLKQFIAWYGRGPEQRRLAVELLSLTPSERSGWLAWKSDACDFHVVNAILEHARRHLDDEPREALAAAELALRLIAKPGRPAEGVDRFHVEGRVWLTRGQALRELGNLQEALQSLQRAGRILASGPISPVALAEAKCNEALVRHLIDESDAALRLIRTAIGVLIVHGDTAGTAKCRIAEGIVHFDHARFESAAAAFEEAFRLAVSAGDEATIATASLHLGHYAVERGDHQSGTRHYALAVHYFSREGLMSGRKRAGWGMARLLAAEGKFDMALRSLHLFVEEMTAAGLVVDAALAGAETVDVLMRAGREADAAAMVPAVLHTFTSRRMFRDAMRIVALRAPDVVDRARSSRRNRGSDS